MLFDNLSTVRPFRPALQEIIKKDEDIGALRATLKRANDEAEARAEEISVIRGEAEALKKELVAAADGAREEKSIHGVILFSQSSITIGDFLSWSRKQTSSELSTGYIVHLAGEQGWVYTMYSVVSSNVALPALPNFQ